MINNLTCFCCGTDNKKGLNIQYIYPEKGIARAELTIPFYFSGWKDITHGGFISMILDETMAHACLSMELPAVTAELTIRYVSPVKVNTLVTVKGEVIEQHNKIIKTKSKIIDSAGTCIARGKAKFIIL